MVENGGEVLVHFELLCGTARDVMVPRDAMAQELIHLAERAFQQHPLRLTYGEEPIWENTFVRPLLYCRSAEASMTAIVMPGLRRDFIDLVRERQWRRADHMLHTSRDPRRLALERDELGDSALSWVAHYAACQVSLALLRRLLDLAPADARRRSAGTGFLPLHEAAWGGVPTKAALLLCAAHPGAATTRSRTGELPHDVGRYHHRGFAWPPPEAMQAHGARLRLELRQLRRLAAVRRLPSAAGLRGALALALPLPAEAAAPAASVIASFLLGTAPAPPPAQNAASEVAAGEVADGEAPAPTTSRRRAHGAARRPPPRPRRCQRGGDEAAGVAVDDVVRLREGAKERGRLAGARRVRHRRCAFKELLVVAVGREAAVHHLRAHAVRAVQRELQHAAPTPRWPSKAARRRERAEERALKRFDQDVVQL